MKLYAIKSKAGSVGFRTVVMIDTEEDLKKIQESYEVDEITAAPAKTKKVNKKK
jgi:hypothetical protein